MATATPEIEALEAEETEEEKNIDELASALEASLDKEVEDEPTDEKGDEPLKEVVEEEPKEDLDKEPEEGAEEVSDKEPPEDVSLAQGNRELRQLLRDQKKELATLQAKVGRIEKGIADDEIDPDAPPPELSKIEEYQEIINNIGKERGALFEVLVEAMEANPKYSDVQDVCTRENFDDIFEELGRAIAKERGGNPLERQLEIEAEVWAMPNPYKYMHGIIKQYHPRYAELEEDKPPKDKEPEKKKKPAEPAKAPTSIASVGGGDQDSKSGWTAKRIDSLPEEELDSVPKEVYQKYLRGELD